MVNESGEVDPEVEKTFLEKYNCLVADYDAVVITGSWLPGFSNKIIPEMVSNAKKANKLVFADYRSVDLKNSFISKTIRPDFVKINMDEFRETFLDRNNNDFDPNKKLQEISKKYNNTFIITQGSEETLIAEHGNINSVMPQKVVPINPIGCGDSFLTGLTMGILEGKSLKEAVELGSKCAEKNAVNLRPGYITSGE